MMPSDVLLDQLAEECSELIHAVIKLRRAREGRTPVSEEGAEAMVKEELADVQLCLTTFLMKQSVGYVSDVQTVMEEKEKRWIERLNRY